MKTPKVEIEALSNGKYALYINGNYVGSYCKAILNINLMEWHLPEIEI